MTDILVDTREKQPWTNLGCFSFASKKLDTGDYSLSGLEDQFCIERKKSVAEFAHNITEKRFTRELERMSKMKWPFLFLEFDCSDISIYPYGQSIPKKQMKNIRVTPSFILSKIAEIQMKYDVRVVLCRNLEYAQILAECLIKKVEKYAQLRSDSTDCKIISI